jgi:pimeloyl-ACP methyl ester carboxylesterase
MRRLSRGRWRRPLVIALISVVLLSVLIVIVGGWYFSYVLLKPGLLPSHPDITVIDVHPDSVDQPRTVTFERTPDTIRPGVFGFDAFGGSLSVGRIIAVDEDSVTRRVQLLEGGAQEGVEGRAEPVPFNGNPSQSLSRPFQAIDYPSAVGPMPAWFTRGKGDTWAVLVHGYKAPQEAFLRDYSVLDEFDLPILNITYRNDPGSPDSSDDLIHLGADEWADVEAAMKWAQQRGARRFVLFGDSMGGALVTTFYRKSDLADKVDALVLDSPVLDWNAVLDQVVADQGLPDFPLVPTTEAWIQARAGVDLSDLNQLDHADAFDDPILLFHGTDDTIVPIETSAEFAEARPDLVTFYPVNYAEHLFPWAVDPKRYEARLRSFLDGPAGLQPQDDGRSTRGNLQPWRLGELDLRRQDDPNRIVAG